MGMIYANTFRHYVQLDWVSFFLCANICFSVGLKFYLFQNKTMKCVAQSRAQPHRCTTRGERYRYRVKIQEVRRNLLVASFVLLCASLPDLYFCGYSARPFQVHALTDAAREKNADAARRNTLHKSALQQLRATLRAKEDELVVSALHQSTLVAAADKAEAKVRHYKLKEKDYRELISLLLRD